LVSRNEALAKQYRSRESKPPKPTPQKTAQSPKLKPSNANTQNGDNGSEDRSKAVSSIQRGIRQADASLDDQQKQLRNFTYGQNDDERSFRLAAKAIAS
jgi:hypothetical protein